MPPLLNSDSRRLNGSICVTYFTNPKTKSRFRGYGTLFVVQKIYQTGRYHIIRLSGSLPKISHGRNVQRSSEEKHIEGHNVVLEFGCWSKGGQRFSFFRMATSMAPIPGTAVKMLWYGELLVSTSTFSQGYLYCQRLIPMAALVGI